jgi:hypothetical protein
MKLLNISILIMSLASFAGAEDQQRAGDLGKAPVQTTKKAEAISGLVKDAPVAARDHAFLVKDEVVLVQGNQKFVIPVKSITGVSYSAVNVLSISVSPSPLTEVPSPPLLVKTKDRYVGIVWTDKSETNGVILRVGIGEYWGFMNGLEAAGIRAVNSDVVSIIK